jgi:hypothetical protein
MKIEFAIVADSVGASEPGSICYPVFQMRRYLDDFEWRQPVPAPRHVAFGIAGHAGAANFRPHRINPA